MSQNMVPYEELSSLGRAARIADQIAREQTLEDYRRGKAAKTLERQQDDVAVFEHYLHEAGIEVAGMYEDLRLWAEISQGLVKGFVRWQLAKGYRIGSINVRLSTVRVYCSLATSAGYLATESYQLIAAVKKISEKEGRNIDEVRPITQVGYKKAAPVAISPSHVALIKGRLRGFADAGDELAARDLLLFCLLSDHGLRCGEVAALAGTSLDLTTGILRFYRRKVHKWQLHRLTPETLAAAQRYVQMWTLHQHLFLGERAGTGLAARTINWRIGEIGRLASVEDLSPHDVRHYWATYVKGDVGALQQAGGWNSPVMALKYRLESTIANEGITVPGQERSDG